MAALRDKANEKGREARHHRLDLAQTCKRRCPVIRAVHYRRRIEKLGTTRRGCSAFILGESNNEYSRIRLAAARC